MYEYKGVAIIASSSISRTSLNHNIYLHFGKYRLSCSASRLLQMSDQVSSGTAFWSLTPLALNIMAQPSGRACGFHPRLRTYLRASPFVCATDGIAILIRFIVCLRYKIPFRAAAQATLAARYVTDEGWDDSFDSESVQTLERLTFVRWLIFVFGTLPQAIKLTALCGIPWTIAWGYMYLIPFILVELLSLISPSRYPPVVHESSSPLPKRRRVRLRCVEQ